MLRVGDVTVTGHRGGGDPMRCIIAKWHAKILACLGDSGPTENMSLIYVECPVGSVVRVLYVENNTLNCS